MSHSFTQKLLAGAWAAFMSRQFCGHDGVTQENVTNGDVIKVNRGAYDHYGIYVSDGPHVIHYTGATGPADFNGMVRETSVEEFLNGAESFTVCRFPKSMNEFDATMRPAAWFPFLSSSFLVHFSSAIAGEFADCCLVDNDLFS